MFKRIIHKINQAFCQTIIGLITLYRWLLSPLLGNCCRFYPSCSQYAQTALRRFGIVVGLYLLVRRLLRCHPLHSGGFDPVPDRLK